jgi:hypothetical protein
MCLVSLTVLNSAAPVFVSVGFDPVDTPLEPVQDGLEGLMFMFLFLPPLFWAYHLYRSFRSLAADTAFPSNEQEEAAEANEGQPLQARLLALEKENVALKQTWRSEKLALIEENLRLEHKALGLELVEGPKDFNQLQHQNQHQHQYQHRQQNQQQQDRGRCEQCGTEIPLSASASKLFCVGCGCKLPWK